MSEQDIALPGMSGEGRRVPAVMRAPANGAALPGVTARTNPLTSRLLWLVSFPTMLGAFLVARIFASGRAFFVDPDLWWHIKTGEIILATHHWPTTDPYSFTVAGAPWISYEWFGEIVLAAASRIGGVLGLDILLIALGSAVMVALYYYGTLRSGNSKAGFVAAGLLSSLAFISFTLRPQMLGYLFLVLTMIALEFFRQGKHRALWFLPPLMLLWVNTHGSFIIGLGAIFVYWIAGLKDIELGGIVAKAWTPPERRQISFIFLLCLAVLPITPYGTQLAVYPFDMAFSQPLNVANVLEWRSMPFDQTGGKIFLAILVGFVILQVAYRFSWRLEEFALFLFGTMMACLHARFLLIFVPFCAPLLATIFARWLPRYDRAKEHYVLNAILIAGVLIGMAWFRPTQASVEEKVAKKFPVAAVNYMREHPIPGPMLNNYGFGGYLIGSLGPEHKVFIDGRGDLFERGGVFADYMAAVTLKPAGLFVLNAYHIQSCLIYRNEPLATVLSASSDWLQVYSDSLSVIFVRRKEAQDLLAAPRVTHQGN